MLKSRGRFFIEERISLSQRAVNYYSYQRCKSGTLESHEEVERFSYKFHFEMYQQFRKYLSPGQRSLDIGCGIGVINIFTSEFFQEIFLLDKTVGLEDLKDTYYGFHGEGYSLSKDDDVVGAPDANVHGRYCFYNDLEVSRDVVTHNTQGKEVYTVESDRIYDLDRNSFDFVQSHMSWGWHFPFKTYRDVVLDLLKPSGILVVDIRDGTTTEKDHLGFTLIDKLPNREKNSKKYVFKKC